MAEEEWCVPKAFDYDGSPYMGMMMSPEILDRVKKFEIREDDVIIVAGVKAGTTWMREIIGLIKSGGEPVTEDKGSRCPMLEFQLPGRPANVDHLENLPSPRLYSTHLQAPFLESEIRSKKPKTLVIFRNPKDILVSQYHYHRAAGVLGTFKGTFHEFFQQAYVNKKLVYGSICEFFRGWWALRDLENVKVVLFEDIKKNHEGAVREIAEHLGRNLSDDVIKTIVEKTTVKVMQANPAVNAENLPKHIFDSNISKYIRKGEVGDWKNYFTEEEEKIVDGDITEPLRKEGLIFRFED